MKSNPINQWLTLGANFGVLIGIILLVVELSQNREMTRAQTRNELSRGLADVLNPLLGEEFADIILRANSGEQLSPNEKYRLIVQNELTYRYWENVHYQYRQGLYDESEFSRHGDTIAFVIASNPRLKIYWCLERSFYSVPFMEFIDQIILREDCP